MADGHDKEAFRETVDELRQHMEEEGELDEPFSGEAIEAFMSLPVKLTRKPGDTRYFAVPSNEDWIHDALDEVQIIPGVLYASDEPFIAESLDLTGYFQADDTGAWVAVVSGEVPVDADADDADWQSDLLGFPEIVRQYEEALVDPRYRHLIEQAAMECAARGAM